MKLSRPVKLVALPWFASVVLLGACRPATPDYRPSSPSGAGRDAGHPQDASHGDGGHPSPVDARIAADRSMSVDAERPPGDQPGVDAAAPTPGIDAPPDPQQDARSIDAVVVVPDGSGGPPAGELVVLAAGDISGSGGSQSKTAALVTTLMKAKPVAAVITLGDHAYEDNTLSELDKYYATSWGTPDILAITRPAPGNHEYQTAGAKGYFDYFNGAGKATGRAGERGKGYYSYDLGAWHFLVVNSNDECEAIPCDEGSAQLAWIRADLAASKSRCSVAYMHHPRFNQGVVHQDTVALKDVWNALYDGGVDIVLTGHEHTYQQFAPMDKTGNLDRDKGIRSFIVGSGGIDLFTDGFNTTHKAADEFKQNTKFGVLELTLSAETYAWRFVAVGGAALVSGSDRCH